MLYESSNRSKKLVSSKHPRPSQNRIRRQWLPNGSLVIYIYIYIYILYMYIYIYIAFFWLLRRLFLPCLAYGEMTHVAAHPKRYAFKLFLKNLSWLKSKSPKLDNIFLNEATYLSDNTCIW